MWPSSPFQEMLRVPPGSSTVTSRSVRPSRTPATQTAHAPVPHASVLPLPRSQVTTVTEGQPKKKGKFVIKALKPRKVLAAYGVGPYEKKSPELMKLLMAEAKKRKLKPAGPMCQISFMDPKETAAEELVSEMQIPIKGGKKKKK